MKKKMSKRYKNLLGERKKNSAIVVDEAIKLVKKNCNTKFNESIDVSINLNLKQKKEEFNVRTIVNLPHGNGKTNKVSVLCEESKINEAKESGADISGSETLVEQITEGKINFDKLIATPAMMSKMGKLGKILGPKGLMPNPKLGTVTDDLKKAVTDAKSGQVEIKNDKDGNLATSIGRKNFPENKILENYNSLVESIKKEKPNSLKGEFIISTFITSTMGISYKIK